MELLRRAEDPRRMAFASPRDPNHVRFDDAARHGAPARGAEHPGRGAHDPWQAFADVSRNPRARLLLFVFGIENFGTAILAVFVACMMRYVYALAQYTTVFMLLLFVPAVLFVPVWIRLSRRFGNRDLWVFSMSLMALAFAGLAFVPGDAWLVSRSA